VTTADPLREMLDHVEKTIGLDVSRWPTYPGGYPDECEAALLDSVFSLQARYGRSADRGARAVVNRWRQHTERTLNSLRLLVQDVDRLGGPDGFRRVLGNDQIAVPRAPDQPTKALAVYTSAKSLLDIDVVTAEDVAHANDDRPKELEKAIRTGRGIGQEAATYFLMNLGIPGVKADTMIQRFADVALGRPAGPQTARRLVSDAADFIGVNVLQLDHAIWRFGRVASESRCKSTGRFAASPSAYWAVGSRCAESHE
jgi:hypothetical protein